MSIKTVDQLLTDLSFQELDDTFKDLMDSIKAGTVGTGAGAPAAAQLILNDFPYKPLDQSISALMTNLLSNTILPNDSEPATPLEMNMYKALLDGDSLSSSQIWPTPTSINTERRAGAIWTNFAALMFQAFDVRYAQGFGTSGHSAEDIQSGLAAGVAYGNSAQVDDVFLVPLGTNDVEGTTPIATLKGIYKNIMNSYLGVTSNPHVWIGLPLPRGDFEGYSAGVKSGYIVRLIQIRQALTEAVSEIANPKLHLVDAWASIVDPSIIDAGSGSAYYPLPGMIAADGVHLIHAGAHIYAKILKSAYMMVKNLTYPTALPSTTGALNSNVTMAGTDGNLGAGASAAPGATGNGLATSTRVNRSSGSAATAVLNKRTDVTIFNLEMETQELVLSSATASEEFQFTFEYPEVQHTPDGLTGVELMIPVRVLAGALGMNGIQLATRVTIGGSQYVNKDMTFVSGNKVPTDVQDIEWLLRTEPLLLPATLSTQFTLFLRLFMDGTIPGNGCTLWVGQPTAKFLTP